MDSVTNDGTGKMIVRKELAGVVHELTAPAPIPLSAGVDQKWLLLANGQDIGLALAALALLRSGDRSAIEQFLADPGSLEPAHVGTMVLANPVDGRSYVYGKATTSSGPNEFASVELFERRGGGDLLFLCAQLPNIQGVPEWHAGFLWMTRQLQDSETQVLDVPRSYPLATTASTLEEARKKLMTTTLSSSWLTRVGPPINTNNANVNTDAAGGDGGIKCYVGFADPSVFQRRADGKYDLRPDLETDDRFHQGVRRAVFMPLSEAMKIFTQQRDNNKATNGMALAATAILVQNLDSLK